MATVQHNRPPLPARDSPTTPRSAPPPSIGSINNNKRARKEHCLNWVQQEVFALIAVKRAIYFEERDMVDEQDLMTPENTKWL